MATITVHTHGQTIPLESRTGETLHQALTRYGIYHTAPCGGQGLCKHCKVVVSGAVSPPQKKEYEHLTDEELLAGVRLCCMTLPTGDCQVTLPAEDGQRQEPASPLTVQPAPTQGEGAVIGIDIGTTTLAVYLYSAAGQCLATASEHNRQSVFGDDVISRIHAVTTLQALPQLQQTVVTQLTRLIEQVCRRGGVSSNQITHCAVAANTTMLHLLTGLDPTPMGAAPFTPQSLFGTLYRGEQLGLPLLCDVYLIPCISAFVGGDVTAGMGVCQMDQTDQTILLIDVGTNGEMALCHGGQIYCLATAAGPAFEGAHISHGVGGVPGAVYAVTKTEFHTIDHAPPVGLCGSGMLDLVSLMLETGALDESGYLEEPYTLADTSLSLSPRDIRELQLAKSAIASGVLRLCQLAELQPEQIHKVCFAGGFGSHIRPASAAAVGLIPSCLADKCQAVGNTAGLGAVQAALSREFRDRLDALSQRVTYFELSGDARFNELFMENMLFEG